MAVLTLKNVVYYNRRHFYMDGQPGFGKRGRAGGSQNVFNPAELPCSAEAETAFPYALLRRSRAVFTETDYDVTMLC